MPLTDWGGAARVGQHGQVTDDKTPVEQAVDLVLFAPIGFALEARKLVPTFVERGRQQVQMARVIGQFAVKQGQAEGKARLSRAQVQAEAILAEFGLGTPNGTTGAGPATRQPTDADAVQPESEPAAVPSARSSSEARSLAIADYDSLAASQVIPRLAGLGVGELDAVRTYEAAHRGRKTILGKVAQLQGE